MTKHGGHQLAFPSMCDLDKNSGRTGPLGLLEAARREGGRLIGLADQLHPINPKAPANAP
jgi:hypothetical protein